MKIGIVSWKQGGGTNDYVLPDKSKPWMKNLKVVTKGKYKGKIPFEKALIEAMKYKYKENIEEINYINSFNEKKLKHNDINFLVSLNLLAAWEKGDKEYKRVLKIMKDPTINIYPNLKEQMFLFDKGDYLNYYKDKGLPIAPTFILKKDRNVRRLIAKVEEHGWTSFVLKPYYAYANIGIGKFDLGEPDVKDKVAKYLTKHKRFPAFVCQEVMDGFAKFLEVKSFWLNGKFKYYVAMKASGAVFDIDEIDNPDDFGKVSPSVLKQIKLMSQKIIDNYPSNLNKFSNPPMYLRIDFGCCKNNTLDGKSYFFNEIEFAGCAIFTEESKLKNITELWADAYYKKALDYLKSNKKQNRQQTNNKKTLHKRKRNISRKKTRKKTRRK